MKVKNFLAMAFAAATLVACNDHDEINNAGGVDTPGGELTYATFSFNVEGATGTRANMATENADETTVDNIRLLIFDAEAADGELLAQRSVDHGTRSATIATTSGAKRIFVFANSGADKTELTAKLNGLTEKTDAVAGTKLSTFYGLISDEEYTGTAAADTDMGDEFYELLKTGSMLMSNVADASSRKVLLPNITQAQTEAPGADATANHYTFKVKRAVAKGSLRIIEDAATIDTKDNIFTLKNAAGDITFGVRNVNRSTKLVQQFDNDQITSNDEEDAHAANGARPRAAFYNVFDGKAEADMQTLDTYKPYYFGGYAIKNDVPVLGNTAISVGHGATRSTNVYFSENSNNRQVRGNTTYFGIATQVQSIPADDIVKTFTFNGLVGTLQTTAADAAYDNTAGNQNFWFIRSIPAEATITFATPADDRRVFVDEDLAFQALYTILLRAKMIRTDAGETGTAPVYADANELKAKYNAWYNGAGGDIPVEGIHDIFGKYENGRSYYRLNIYETIDATTKRHLVRRNHSYNAAVNSFATIGEPTEEDLDKNPDKPVDAEITHVSATIEVQPWHTVDMEDDL